MVLRGPKVVWRSFGRASDSIPWRRTPLADPVGLPLPRSLVSRQSSQATFPGEAGREAGSRTRPGRVRRTEPDPRRLPRPSPPCHPEQSSRQAYLTPGHPERASNASDLSRRRQRRSRQSRDPLSERPPSRSQPPSGDLRGSLDSALRASLGMTEERAAHAPARPGILTYGTVADHAVVSPDSKPSKNTGAQQLEVALRMLKSPAVYHIV